MNKLIRVREEMAAMEAKKQSYSWWFESHNSTTKRSKWLKSTLAELDQKTKAMLKLIDQDADSFAQRAEMFYKKRPELISMVEEFYRAHRSLAERYEQLKHDSGTRLTSPLVHPLSSPRSPFQKISFSSKNDGYTQEAYGSDESCDSEVDDPFSDHDTPFHKVGKERKAMLQCGIDYEEVMKLTEEIKRLKEDNEFQNQVIQSEGKMQQELKAQLAETNEEEVHEKETEELAAAKTSRMMQVKDEDSDEVTRLREEVERLRAENVDHKKQLTQKDEEKREVIRQLSVAVEILRGENLFLKKSIVKQAPAKKKPVDSYRFKGFGKLFSLLPKSQTSVIPI